MPYPTTASLPDYVKKMSPKKQAQWRAAFNSAIDKYKDEATAFKVANAAVKESVSMKKNRDVEMGTELSEAMATTKIIKDQGIIEGVLILTGNKVSKNKTMYGSKVLQEAATRYEGAKMFLDHPKQGETVRSVRDFGGTYKNVRLEEGKYLRADLHLVPNEAVRSTVIPIAESKPTGVGLSIRDRGHGREENGVFLVEGFAGKGPFSIDLVMDASVNESLFESNQGGNEDMDLSKLTLAELLEGAPALVEQIKNEAKTAVLKELEEKIKAGDDAGKMVTKGKKLIALAEAGLPKEVAEKVRPIIESDSMSVEGAEGVIKAQKEIVEALKPATTKDPAVTGHGAHNDTELAEGELPSDDAFARALQG